MLRALGWLRSSVIAEAKCAQIDIHLRTLVDSLFALVVMCEGILSSRLKNAQTQQHGANEDEERPSLCC